MFFPVPNSMIIFFKDFIYSFERERESTSRGQGQREREKETPPWDYDLSQRQTPN